ncbi:MAG: hypothetical protein FJ388_22210, partial [Verrucomicrobia bacterium]|nr:hypothetical protein [Verrucomicrobiota bacterium]
AAPSAGTYTLTVSHKGTLSGGQQYYSLILSGQADKPSVTLSLSGSPLPEAGGVATVTATLSRASSLPVTVNLAFSGTATLATDYTASATSILIAPGSLSGSVRLTALQDAIAEENETIVVDIDTVVNAIESVPQRVTATIADDDPSLFVVDGVTLVYPGTFMVGTNRSFSGLIVTNAGVLRNTSGVVGNSVLSGSNWARVTGAGSLWSNSANLSIGATGSLNSLTISAGGTVAASNVFVGAAAASTGNVITLSGGFLFATNRARNGTLDIRRGALTLNSGTATVNRLYATNGASSVVTFNGGTFNSGNSLVNIGTQFRVGDGVNPARLNLNGGTHWFANGLFISANATLSGTGTIIKPAIGNVSDAGVIAPGNSVGTLTFNSDLTLLNTALLSMELGGTNDWLYDQVNVEETFNFQGSLNVSLLGGFTPQFGDWFDLFDFGAAYGRFSQINLPALNPALYWNTDYLYTSGRLLVGDRQAAWMVSPADGSTFASSQA